MKKLAIYISIISLILSCNNGTNSHGHSHDVVGADNSHDGHAHGNDENTLSYTIFKGDYELFVEFSPLVTDAKSNFAAHFTRLSDYKPLTEGNVTVSIIKDGKGIRHTVDAPASPGIFRPALQPKESGIFNMSFELKLQDETILFDLGKIEVLKDQSLVKTEQEPAHENEVSYLKEQAWKTEFAIYELIPSPHHNVILTSAKVMAHPKLSKTVPAQANGIFNLIAIEGETVKNGEVIGVISSAGIDENLKTKLEEAKIKFNKSKADFLRTKPLFESEAISKKEFNAIESIYHSDSLKYNQMATKIFSGGVSIQSPVNGFISKIISLNGSYVSQGTELVQVTSKENYMVECYINQSNAIHINRIYDAYFKIPSTGKILELSNLDGKIASENTYIEDNATRIPFHFIISGNEVIYKGQVLEVYLLSDKKENALKIPLSSVIEEQGNYYVYVQSGGESFIKREISFINNDGKFIEVSKGLSIGERVVSKGAYQVKLASMAGDLPLHGHTH